MQTIQYAAPRQDAIVCQRFNVRGMTCSHCEMAVTAELCRLDGVAHVAVDVAAGTVVVESTVELDMDTVAAAVDEAGYELSR